MSKMLVVADGEIRLGKFEPEAQEPPRVFYSHSRTASAAKKFTQKANKRPALARLSVTWSRIFMALLACFDVLFM